MKPPILILFLITAVAANANILIDDFQTAQSLSSDGDPYPAGDWVQGQGIYGGERDLLIWNDLSGTVNGTTSSGTFLYTQDAGSSSEFTLIWGGLDSMASASPRSSQIGLIDLLDLNVVSLDVTYGSLSFVGTETVMVRFLTGAGLFSHSIDITTSDANGTIQFDIADFGMGNNASDVRAIWLEHGLFGQGLSSIEIVNVEFFTVPEPKLPHLIILMCLILGILRLRYP